MRTMSEIFKIVIQSGHYERTSFFMCNALDLAVSKGLISEDERVEGMKAIHEYMEALAGKVTFELYEALDISGLGSPNYKYHEALGFSEDDPYDDVGETLRTSYCLPIYLDWDKRPFPK